MAEHDPADVELVRGMLVDHGWGTGLRQGSSSRPARAILDALAGRLLPPGGQVAERFGGT